VKVRIGIGVGGVLLDTGELAEVVDAIDETGLDSLWLSEVLTAPVIDPIVGLAWAAAHSTKVKLGTTMLLPGRNPLRLAKALASLDRLSGGRLLITMVPGLGTPPERNAIGVPPKERAGVIDEVMPLLRQLWAGESVTYESATVALAEVSLSPLPVQQPLEMWLGGMSAGALRRCGRLADGWLPSLCTPSEAAEGRKVIDDAAAAADRAISPEHFGVSIGYARAPLDERAAMAVAARSRGHDPSTLVPVGMSGLRALIEGYLEVGFSKFVVRPMATPSSWRAELEELAGAVGDLQT